MELISIVGASIGIFLTQYAATKGIDELLKQKPHSIETQFLDALSCAHKTVCNDKFICKDYLWEYDRNAIFETFKLRWNSFNSKIFNSTILKDILQNAVGDGTVVTDEITEYWSFCIIEEISKPERDKLFRFLQLNEKFTTTKMEEFDDLFIIADLSRQTKRISDFINTVFCFTNPYSFEIIKNIDSTCNIINLSYKRDETIYNIRFSVIVIYSDISTDKIINIFDNAQYNGVNLLMFLTFLPLSFEENSLINEYASDLGINILIKGRDALFQYNTALKYKYYKIFVTLGDSILESFFNLYYNGFDITATSNEHFVDRDKERAILTEKMISSFFIEGASESGKSALVRNILLEFAKNHKIFWHTIYEKQDAEVINKTFWNDLKTFFSITYKDQTLAYHFGDGTRGFHFTDGLKNILVSLFKKHNPIFVIDNIHNCLPNNETLKQTFETIIMEKLCRAYFIGWEGGYISFVANENYLKRISLKGMSSVYLNLILEHHTGKSNPAIAEKLSDGLLHGLPGYAKRYDPNFKEEDLLNENAFTQRIIKTSSDEEKIVLISLSIVNSPVLKRVFEMLGYIEVLNVLIGRRLVELEQLGYTVHDNYKPFFKTLRFDNHNLEKIINFIEYSAKYNPIIYVELINFLIEREQIEGAYNILEERFSDLMQKDCFSSLLVIIQKLENIKNREIDKTNLKAKKIILLERMSEYRMCYEYLQLIEGVVSPENMNYADLFYIKIRCLYFQDKFEEILNICMTEFETIKLFTPKLQIQVFFIVARIYWIRGDNLVNALKPLLVCFRMAEKIDNVPLMIKAIHRITMLECGLGLLEESLSSFQALYDNSNFVAGRRKTFLLYRKAKCLNLLGRYDEAKEICYKTIELKKSFNDVRGLIFVNKLLAKIYYNEGDDAKALAYTEHATLAAKQSGVLKEETANNLTKATILMSIDRMIEAKQLLQICLDNCLEMGLAYRISQIKRVASQSTELLEISELSDKMYKACIEKNQTQASIFFVDYFDTKISKNDRQLCNKLFNDKSLISKKLLLVTNLI